MTNVVSRRETAKTIAEMADKKGVSAKDIAKLTRVTQRTVYSWYKGDRLPSLDRLYLLSWLFKCKLSEMIQVNPQDKWRKG